MHDEYMIRWNEEAKMWYFYISDIPFMKNKKRSTLMRKASDWLKSQGM